MVRTRTLAASGADKAEALGFWKSIVVLACEAQRVGRCLIKLLLRSDHGGAYSGSARVCATDNTTECHYTQDGHHQLLRLPMLASLIKGDPWQSKQRQLLCPSLRLLYDT